MDFRVYQNSKAFNNYAIDKKNNDHEKKISFGFASGALINLLSNKMVVSGLECVKNNPAVEVSAMDTTTMIAPRTYVDSKQNPVYGFETFCRETFPMLFNPFGPGIIAAVMMSSKGYKGVSAGKDTLQSLHKAWNDSGGTDFKLNGTPEEKKQIVQNYARKVLENATGTAKNRAFINLGKTELDEFSSKLAELILQDKDKKTVKTTLSDIAEKYTLKTGAASSLEVKLHPKHKFSSDISVLLDDIFSVGKKVFTQAEPKALQDKVEDLVKFSKNKSGWAAGISVAGMVCLPPLTNAITRWRTGSCGYCAYQDFGKKDNNMQKDSQKKDNFAVLRAKAIGVGLIGTIMLTTMGAFKKGEGFFIKGGLKNFVNKIELKGKSAHLDLIKLIYGVGLLARVISSRDEQEAKVTTLRDSCGFLNWLVLGGFVTKGVAHLADKKNGSFMNITGPIKDKSVLKTAFNWLNNVSIKTHSEMRTMNQGLPEAQGRKNMAIHTAAILAGYAYSLITLGIGMPVLSNYLTNKAREKQLAQKGNFPTNSIEQTFVSNNLAKSFFKPDVNLPPANAFVGSSLNNSNDDTFINLIKIHAK